MDITVSHERGSVPVAVLKLNGHLDGQTYQDLIAKAQQIAGEGVRNILLDLSDLTYISSAGLVALHTIALLLQGKAPLESGQGLPPPKVMEALKGGAQMPIRLLNPRPEVISVLDMAGFSAFFEVFTDKQKALESF